MELIAVSALHVLFFHSLHFRDIVDIKALVPHRGCLKDGTYQREVIFVCYPPSKLISASE